MFFFPGLCRYDGWWMLYKYFCLVHVPFFSTFLHFFVVGRRSKWKREEMIPNSQPRYLKLLLCIFLRSFFSFIRSYKLHQFTDFYIYKWIFYNLFPDTFFFILLGISFIYSPFWCNLIFHLEGWRNLSFQSTSEFGLFCLKKEQLFVANLLSGYACQGSVNVDFGRS